VGGQFQTIKLEGGANSSFRVAPKELGGYTPIIEQSTRLGATGIDADGDATASQPINLAFRGDGNLTAVGSGSALGGGEAAEILRGGTGADALFGGGGSDVLIGGGGGDILTGSSGHDTFKFVATTDSRPGTTGGAPNYDLVTDFTSNTSTTVDATGKHTSLTGDVISLTDIDANMGLSGDQAFQFVGTVAFTGAGQIRYFQSGDKTIIQGNTDSDVGTVEFEVHLTGTHTLTKDSFDL
jgi:Ca2+-binding RTX toxin-like protein